MIYPEAKLLNDQELADIQNRINEAESWSRSCGNAHLDWSEGMYPQKHEGPDLVNLLATLRALKNTSSDKLMDEMARTVADAVDKLTAMTEERTRAVAAGKEAEARYEEACKDRAHAELQLKLMKERAEAAEAKLAKWAGHDCYGHQQEAYRKINRLRAVVKALRAHRDALPEGIELRGKEGYAFAAIESLQPGDLEDTP